jgi:hypothetical protein
MIIRRTIRWRSVKRRGLEAAAALSGMLTSGTTLL